MAAVVLLAVAATAARAQYPAEGFEALLEPSERVELASQVPGVLETVIVERGDRVLEGQVVARLTSGLQRLAVEMARARLAYARRRAERNEELYLKQLISSHERDEQETEVRLAEIELADVEERLSMRTIHSPITGVVVDRIHTAGEYVGTDVILSLARIDPLHVEVIVPVAHYGSIERGQVGLVSPEEPIGGEHKATVILVDEVVDAASGTFGVRLELANADHRIVAGLRCQVRFESAEKGARDQFSK